MAKVLFLPESSTSLCAIGLTLPWGKRISLNNLLPSVKPKKQLNIDCLTPAFYYTNFFLAFLGHDFHVGKQYNASNGSYGCFGMPSFLRSMLVAEFGASTLPIAQHDHNWSILHLQNLMGKLDKYYLRSI